MPGDSDQGVNRCRPLISCPSRHDPSSGRIISRSRLRGRACWSRTNRSGRIRSRRALRRSPSGGPPRRGRIRRRRCLACGPSSAGRPRLTVHRWSRLPSRPSASRGASVRVDRWSSLRTSASRYDPRRRHAGSRRSFPCGARLHDRSSCRVSRRRRVRRGAGQSLCADRCSRPGDRERDDVGRGDASTGPGAGPDRPVRVDGRVVAERRRPRAAPGAELFVH